MKYKTYCEFLTLEKCFFKRIEKTHPTTAGKCRHFWTQLHWHVAIEFYFEKYV